MVIEQVAQLGAGGSALRESIVVRAQASEQVGGFGVPANEAKVVIDAQRGGGGKEILQVHADDGRLAQVRQGIGDDGVAASEAGGTGMGLEAAQDAAKDLPLNGLKMLDGREDLSHALVPLGDFKLLVGNGNRGQFSD